MGYLTITTSTAHGLNNGDEIVIRGCIGMTELNGNYYLVADKTIYTFRLKTLAGEYVDGSAYEDYIGWGDLGTVRKTITVVTGLDHLEGETVAILADGIPLSEEVVSGGKITIDSTSGEIHVGLPYTSKLKTMRIEAGSQLGTAQSKTKRISKVVVRVKESVNCLIGTPDKLDEVDFDNSYELYSGDRDIPFPSNYDKDAYVMVEQVDPLPLNILAIIPYIICNED
jgi:hypothetical protein